MRLEKITLFIALLTATSYVLFVYCGLIMLIQPSFYNFDRFLVCIIFMVVMAYIAEKHFKDKGFM